ncbi:MAG TPA: AAA family ATPase [Solirubrobacter sp.]|nr:AAA family ATPase [Solirubrobacter sp.]
MLRVRLLGGVTLEADGRPLEPPSSRPARELLAYLALHPGPHPRLELAMRFWPDVPETSARASLRTTLHELRRALGEAAAHLDVDREQVALVDITTDLQDPEEVINAGEPLAGIDRDWAIAARDEHRERVSELLLQRSHGLDGLRWAREAVKRDPLSEEAARRLMTLLAQAGDRAAAMSAYVRLEERLERELSVAPSRETRRLLAEIRAGAAPPLGTAATPSLPPVKGALAGRATELQTLTHATGAVLLAGEPGIGKTRLLAEAGRLLHQRGRTVLYGRCYEEQVAPYEPFAEALGADAFARALADAQEDRWRLFEAIRARVQGAVLLLDDLHWADAGTLRLLAHLLRSPTPPVVLGAYRDTEIARTHPLAGALVDLRREGLVQRVPLRGLDEPALAQLVGDAAMAATLHRETGGNPFFVEQVLQADDGTIPEGVKDVIGRRLSRLKPEAGRVLSIAAVAGQEFDLALVEAVLNTDALEAVEEAAAAQMVRELRPGRYAFAHALVRETLYDELSLTRRVRTHRALADALARQPGHSVAELAHHRLQADAPGAAETTLEAAREAMRALAYEEAATLCRRALESADDDLKAELHLALGEAQLRAGEPARDAFREAAALARAQQDHERLARAALGFSGLGVTIIAVDREAVDLLEEALAHETSLRAPLLARLAIETYYASTPAQRKALGDEAVALARPHERLDALNARHAALWSSQFLDERLATANEMLALAIERGDAERELQARNWLVLDHFERGDVAAMRTEIDAHEALAERLRLPSYTWWAPMWRASLAILEGHFDDAAALIERLATDRHPNARLYAEIQTFALELTRGEIRPVDPAPIDRERGRPAEYAYRAGYAWILALQGRADEAREHIAWVAHDDFARLRDDMNTLAALCELAQAMHVLKDPTHAAGVLQRLAPYADRNVQNARGAAGYGSAAYHVAVLEALLGRDARPRLEEALRRNEALGSRPWADRAREALRAHAA